MNDIKLFKLISGEEIIGTVVDDSCKLIVSLEDTVTITYHQVEGGKMSAGFAPHMPYSQGKIILNRSAIACTSSVKDEMLEEYKRIFSKIFTPPQSIIL